MKILHMVACVLLWVGGINWGLMGLGYFVNGSVWNVVNMLLGSMPAAEYGVYVLVGLSALWLMVTHRKHCKECSASM